MQLSVIVPVFNEAGNLLPLLEEIHATLETHGDFEVIFVDDGSIDETPALLTAALADHARLRVLRHARRSGQSAALRSGVEAARGDWIVTLDGDGQNDPADIPVLLRQVREQGLTGHWLLAGWRTRRQDSGLKRLSSRLANGLRRRLLRDATPDTGCGLKLFPRATFLALPWFDHMHRFLPALVLCAGGRVISVPVSHRPRREGRSKYGVHNRLWVGLVDLCGVLWLQRRMRRVEVTELTARARRTTDSAAA
jgi:dolichol-phosphate mannosyltransferase